MRHERQVELIRRLFALADSGLDASAPPEYVREQSRVEVAPYRDRAHFDREMDILFRSFPLPLAHISEIGAPGGYVTRHVANTPILLVRDKSGDLRAFVNVCRHRGAQLAHHARGDCKAFVCPYHGWVYDLDGGLKHVPGEAFFPDLDRATLGLVPLPVSVAHGFVWVVPDSEPAPASTENVRDIARYLGSFDDDFSHYGLESHYLFQRSEGVRHCNWKLIADAFLEGYHLKTLHRDSLYRFFGEGQVAFDFSGRHIRSVGGRKNITELQDTPPKTWNIRVCATPFYLIFPSTVVVVHPDYISLLNLLPLDVERTVYAHYLMTPHAPRSDKQAAHFQRSFDLIDGVVFQQEDMAIAESIQRGIRSGAYPHFELGTIEYPIRVFHDHIADLIARVPAD